MLKRGEVPIYEPGLGAVMARNVEAGRLRFTIDLAAAVDGADAVFIVARQIQIIKLMETE